ncbi:hypothetical protein [Nitrosomonas sp.]|nr:hypothetical protein [Nitrosomonas sp.]
MKKEIWIATRPAVGSQRRVESGAMMGLVDALPVKTGLMDVYSF